MKFNPGSRLTLFVCLIMPVLITAGFWQLDRASEKQQLQTAYELQITEPPVELETAKKAAFAAVTFSGEYSKDEIFLVDNATHEGRVGYQVVQVVRTGVKAVLVNRGWIAAPNKREQLPEIKTPAGLRRFEGVLWPNMGLPPLLAEDLWTDKWPKRIQRLNITRMGNLLETNFEWEIRLVSGAPGVLTPPRLHVAFGVDRHFGYALQWFGLAVVLLIGFLVAGFRR